MSVTIQPFVPYPNLQADYMSTCVFWDFTLNGNCFKVELNTYWEMRMQISLVLSSCRRIWGMELEWLLCHKLRRQRDRLQL